MSSQAELKAIKKELKEWEHSFIDSNGRKPEKKDIAADKDIGKTRQFFAL
jgi:hypothetical protein